MIARGFAMFDSAIGRCGIAWSHAGVVGVQLPEAREISKRHLLAIEGVRPTVGKTLFDALLPVAPPRPHP